MTTQTPVRTQPGIETDPERWYLPKRLCPSQTDRAITEVEKVLP